MLKIINAVLASCIVWPLSRSWIFKLCGSVNSSPLKAKAPQRTEFPPLLRRT